MTGNDRILWEKVFSHWAGIYTMISGGKGSLVGLEHRWKWLIFCGNAISFKCCGYIINKVTSILMSFVLTEIKCILQQPKGVTHFISIVMDGNI